MATVETKPSSAPRAAELLRNLKSKDGVYLMYIDGEWTAAADGGTRDLVNPANGEVYAKVAEGTTQDAERAIRAAHREFYDDGWGDSLALDRARLRPSQAARPSTSLRHRRPLWSANRSASADRSSRGIIRC